MSEKAVNLTPANTLRPITVTKHKNVVKAISKAPRTLCQKRSSELDDYFERQFAEEEEHLLSKSDANPCSA